MGRKTDDLLHTYCCTPCSACGDLNGCHIPGKVKRNRHTARFGQSFPKIVCLCGSTRFSDVFWLANLHETLEGNIVLTVGCDTKSDDALQLPPQCKETLDELHKRKIDMADEILVLNCNLAVCARCEKPSDATGGISICCRKGHIKKPYIGSSTRGEIEYAKSVGKPIRYLQPSEES